MSTVLVLSLHTSPLEQPGRGDGGGMNVYVRELSAALARAGSSCEVFTRAEAPDLPAVVEVEPGFRLHHVVAGPQCAVPKGHLHELVDEFADAVAKITEGLDEAPEAVHANYWLSGVAGQTIKRRFDLPLVSTFHTLDRVKAEASPEEVDPVDLQRRARAEAEVIQCSDAVLASCQPEVDQLVDLYGASPERVEIVPPGVDHAFFAPGDRHQARRAIGVEDAAPLLLFVGRIQPLKGADVAVSALHELGRRGFSGARLLVVGGPSGVLGEHEARSLRALADDLGLAGQVTFLPPQRHELLSTFYRAADVCLVPSRSESFGLVALEAAACGTPVVASSVGGLTTLVEHGRTGYLVEGRDVDAFAGHVAQLLSDPALAARIGGAAALGARRYTWSHAAHHLRGLYADLAARSIVECA
jgi:D-inositol-3-phosphate glycosyltransferase